MSRYVARFCYISKSAGALTQEKVACDALMVDERLFLMMGHVNLLQFGHPL